MYNLRKRQTVQKMNLETVAVERNKVSRGFSTLFKIAIQRGIVKGLKRKNNKRTCNPSRSFKVDVSGRIRSDLKNKYSLNSKKRVCDQLFKDLDLFTEINSKNCEGNNNINHFIDPGSLTFKLNNKSSTRYQRTVDGQIRNYKISNPWSITVSFTKVTNCQATQTQEERMNAFLNNHINQ